MAAACPEGGGRAWAGARQWEGISSADAAGAGQATGSVCGVALLERAVRNLVDVGVDEVVVVVGYRAEEIERFCAELSVRLGVSVRCVGNDRFDEGNGLSVLAAEEALGGEPFLLVAADHLLDRSILWSLVGSEMPLDGAVLAVDHLSWRGTWCRSRRRDPSAYRRSAGP